MKLEEILAALKINEREFLTLSEEDWKARIEMSLSNSEQKNTLLAYSDKKYRETFFINNLVETYPPPLPSPSEPLMKPKEIYQFLNLTNNKRAEFLTMPSEEWTAHVKSVLQQKRNNPQNNQQKEINDYLNRCEEFFLTLENVNKRKEFFVKHTSKYHPLLAITPNSVANLEAQKSSNPLPTFTLQANIYTIAGENPEEIAKHKEEIFKAYKAFMSDRYDNLPSEEKLKYENNKHKFLAAFEAKEAYFKDFETLEKSNINDEYKELYKNQKDKFPMTIIILPFDKPEEGKAFMEEITQKEYIKPLSPTSKEERKAEAEDEEKITSNPNSSSPSSTSSTP